MALQTDIQNCIYTDVIETENITYFPIQIVFKIMKAYNEIYTNKLSTNKGSNYNYTRWW